jgi:hypothetical protein
MLVDGGRLDLEQLSHKRLREPKALFRKAAFDPRAAILALVNDQFA